LPSVSIDRQPDRNRGTSLWDPQASPTDARMTLRQRT
jgi:hypothetical protein